MSIPAEDAEPNMADPSSDPPDRAAPDRSPSGRWVGDEANEQPYEPPAITARPVKFITPTELKQGFETVTAEGRTERREYVVLAHIVVDPERDSTGKS